MAIVFSIESYITARLGIARGIEEAEYDIEDGVII